jgi:hypothetical protein
MATVTPEIEAIERQITALTRRLELIRSGAPEAAAPEPDIRRQRALRIGVATYLGHYGPLIVLTAPVIYATFIPLLLLDVSLTLYQWLCFPIYGLPRVKRRDFVVIDRHKLAYLNVLEKLNCLFCEYAIGVLAYATEIGSRTEEFWCPIKHARSPLAEHMRALDFAGHHDAAAYRLRQRESGKQAKGAARRLRACMTCRTGAGPQEASGCNRASADDRSPTPDA